MVGNEFKLNPHNILTDEETAFVAMFSKAGDANTIATAITSGISIEELKSLCIDREFCLTQKMKAALYVRYKYKCSYRACCRIMDNGFNDNQLDAIVNVLLMPAFAIPEERVLNEILYEKYSAEDMIAWYNKVRNN